MAQEDIYQKSLEYHEKPYPGKIAIKPISPSRTALELNSPAVRFTRMSMLHTATPQRAIP